ncbi:TWiK family of potassium channels protein 7-like [Chironomus tepperi]|uniref:TWiK family of potassium channels protein 7-like n=1 Tax=Chironomus tepperi TaxID=113505 RepID=UPI00391F9C7A
MNTKSSLPMPSFVGNTSGQPSPPLCFPPAKVDKNSDSQQPSTLCCCRKAPKSQCIAAIGVLILVIGYTIAGTIIFVSLEGDAEEMDGAETAASKPYPRNDMYYADLRTRTVNQLWAITEDLNILYKENWTRLAAQEVKIFQETLVNALRNPRPQLISNVKQPPPHKWTYASAFLYSLTLITTIGYGGMTPRSQWGRIAALIYAIFGIPIILLYLSTMGEGLSSAMRCIFKRLRATSSKSNSSSSSNTNSTSSSTTTPSSSTSNNILGETTNNNKSKIIESEKRQYAGWNHSGSSIQQQHFHNPSSGNGGSYNNNYLSNSFSITSGSHHKKQKQSVVPISICIMILICYVTSGAVLFHELQKWNVLDSIYFCFTALSTIGFGELQPKDELGMYVASIYIIVGMAIVAMCFSLIQTELIIMMRKFTINEQSHDDEITLANVTITPIKS